MVARLIEFGGILVLAAIIGTAFFLSMTETVYFNAYGGLLFWGPFFVIPLIYYGLIKIVIFKHL